MSNHPDVPSNNEDSTQNMIENTDVDTNADSVEDITLENDLAIEEFFAPSGSAQLADDFRSGYVAIGGRPNLWRKANSGGYCQSAHCAVGAQQVSGA